MSTRLTRELIAADAQSDLEGDDGVTRVGRLLRAALSTLGAGGGAILRYEAAPKTPSCLAAEGIGAPATEILEGRGGQESLAQRACAERRLFVIDRSSRDPLMQSLRATALDLASAAVIPLYDRGLPVAALVLAAREPRALQASSLRLLTPAFHLLGVLLSPGRVGAGAVRADERSAALEQERYVVELEELGNLLHEARGAARLAGEQAASSEAEHRASLESSRARIAELEALASRAEVESSLRRDLESAYAAQGRRIEERERRIAELQAENRELLNQISTLGSRGEELAVSLGDPDEGAVAVVGSSASEPVSEEELREIADAAVAALADVEVKESGDGAADDSAGGLADGEIIEVLESAEAPDGEGEQDVAAMVEAPVEEIGAGSAPQVAAATPIVLFPIEGDAEVREAMLAAAQRSNVAAWTGDGEPPAGRGLLAVNLFDPMIGRVGELVQDGRAQREGLAYGRDAESGTGFELGSVGWLARPIEVSPAVAHIRGRIRGKTGGIVIISSQLRELAQLREALSVAGISSSVACDARQALDLLDIVRSPDAMLVDLSLDGGQGLTIAMHCRTQSETRDTPLLLLLATQPDPARLMSGARRAAALQPFGANEVARLVSAALFRR